MTFWYKRDFEKTCQRYPSDTQRLIVQAVFEVKSWYETRRVSGGLRTKKLYEGPSGRVFEARVSLDLRLLWVEREQAVWFSMVGSHDAVRRYIRTLR